MLIGFGPEVYFADSNGKHIFIKHNAVLMIAMSSFDIPASISFKYVTLSVTENPTFYIKENECINYTMVIY
jgi:hypothetical protein